jgi:hypothetical protein
MNHSGARSGRNPHSRYLGVGKEIDLLLSGELLGAGSWRSQYRCHNQEPEDNTHRQQYCR